MSQNHARRAEPRRFATEGERHRLVVWRTTEKGSKPWTSWKALGVRKLFFRRRKPLGEKDSGASKAMGFRVWGLGFGVRRLIWRPAAPSLTFFRAP